MNNDKLQQAARRLFLRRAAALTAIGSSVPFGLNLLAMNDSVAAASCSAVPGSDYKALVCIFLFGGNDSHNTVIATDDFTWSEYQSARGGSGASDLVVPRAQILPITPTTAKPRLDSGAGTRTFGLHPELASLAPLFNGTEGAARRLAIVANVGTLMAPTSKSQYGAPNHPLPPMLGSHNDQQAFWQAGGPEGATRGWGGLMGDLIGCSNNPNAAVFTGMSPAGNSLWLAGDTVVQYAMLPGSGSAVPLDVKAGPFGVPGAATELQAIIQGSRDGLFEGSYNTVVKRSVESQEQLAAALGRVSVNASPDSGGLFGQQLQGVLRNIVAASSGALGSMRRQVFFCSLGGFDTHDGQVVRQAGGTHGELLRVLGDSLRYFHDELVRLNLINQVTTFTTSDFGRKFVRNGDGTDHAWGAHHFVMGGSVRGGDIYGAFPNMAANSEDVVESGRNLLPRISVDQYGATLGRWFGLSDAQLKQEVFPNLPTFTDGPQAGQYPLNLGFMA